MNHNVSVVASAAAAGAWLICAGVRAQAPEDEERQNLADGQVAYDEGRYAEAAQLLLRALKTYPLPSVAFRAGQALKQLGKLVEAAELYGQAATLEPSGTGEALEVQKKAKSDAARALPGLQERIPQLTLRVQNGAPRPVTVTLDAAMLPPASLGQPLPVNPGSHQIVAQCDEQGVLKNESVTLEEGQRQELVLCPVVASLLRSAPPQKSAAQHTSTASSSPPKEQRPPAGSLAPTLGWIGIGVGGMALVASGVTAGVALEKYSDLECDETDNCRPVSGTNTYNSLKNWSTLTFWVGAPVLAAGVGAVLWSGRQKERGPEREGVTAWVGLGSAGLSGRFQ